MSCHAKWNAKNITHLSVVLNEHVCGSANENKQAKKKINENRFITHSILWAIFTACVYGAKKRSFKQN